MWYKLDTPPILRVYPQYSQFHYNQLFTLGYTACTSGIFLVNCLPLAAPEANHLAEHFHVCTPRIGGTYNEEYHATAINHETTTFLSCESNYRDLHEFMYRC